MNINDRRGREQMRAMIVSVASATIVGMGAAYFATQVAVAVQAEQIKTLKETMNSIMVVTEIVRANQVQLAARGEWIKSTERRLDILERHSVDADKRLDFIESNRYTKNDAAMDFQILRGELDEHHSKAHKGGKDE